MQPHQLNLLGQSAAHGGVVGGDILLLPKGTICINQNVNKRVPTKCQI